MSEKITSLIPSSSLIAKLTNSASKEWGDYTQHEFVQKIADGSLSENAFKHYLTQDYLFLIQFARAYGLAIFKATTFDDMRSAARAISGILDVEMDLHIKYCSRWGISERELRNVNEDKASMAYTRFVLERGTSGDILDLYVALSPCVVGYGVIGAELSDNADTKKEGNPYYSWIEMYSSDDYQKLVHEAITQLDRLSVSRGGEARYEELVGTFRSATILEADFWQMGLNASI
jgi:thiaminase/transcriptional activator TenA